jgi:phosphoadenosine phosphosulfate reductase
MESQTTLRIVEKPFNDSVLRTIEDDLMADQGAQEILTWGVKNFHPKLALSASFGGIEGMVILDMMQKIEPESRVFVLDTGRLPQATHDLIDRVRDRYGVAVEVILPNAQLVQETVAERGVNFFYESIEDRKSCCRMRKVLPLRAYLGGLDAYVSGLRRDQNLNRANTRKVEFDASAGGIVKLNPLADWSHDQVEDYVRAHEVPVNRLHAEGYPSVGCEPCSRAIRAGDDPRAGRWWWENDDTKECGIHVAEEEGGSGI